MSVEILIDEQEQIEEEKIEQEDFHHKYKDQNATNKFDTDQEEEGVLSFYDLDPGSYTIVYTNSLLVMILSAMVAGLGLFLVSSPTSGLITQIVGSVIFLLGILIICA